MKSDDIQRYMESTASLLWETEKIRLKMIDAKHRRIVGGLTDPHHVAKQMQRDLFYNLKALVNAKGRRGNN